MEKVELADKAADKNNSNSKGKKNPSDSKETTKIPRKNAETKQKTGKWCVYHRSKTHDTTECKYHLGQVAEFHKRQADKNKSSGYKKTNPQGYVKQEDMNAIMKKLIQEEFEEARKRKKQNNDYCIKIPDEEPKKKAAKRAPIDDTDAFLAQLEADDDDFGYNDLNITEE